MKTIPELLLKCCGEIHKPHSIKILDDCIKITFRCPVCRNWLYLEIKDGMKKMLFDIVSIKLSEKIYEKNLIPNNHIEKN